MKKTLFLSAALVAVLVASPAFACGDCESPCGTNCTGHVTTGGNMWVDMSATANSWGDGADVDLAAFSSGQYNLNASLGGDDFANISGGFMSGGTGAAEVNVGGSADGFAAWGKFSGWDAPAGW